MNKTNDFTNPVGSVEYTLHSRYGKELHRGSFSEDNPYLAQLDEANYNSRKQDIDALYERAVEWQADRANLLEQRAYDQAVLAEQREYDSPEAQMRRMREAGINPDLVGSSGSGSGVGSGSSAHMADHTIADQTASTPFGSSYNDASLVFQGISAASSALSSLVGGYGAIADSIIKFKSLPSQIKLNESAASLNDAQSNEINTLLSGKKKAVDLSNSMQYVGLVSNLAGMIKNDASDEEFNALVSAAGIPEDHILPTISAIKQAQSTPEFLQNYKKNILADREAQAELEVYTSDVFHSLVEEELQLQELELDFGIINQSLQNKIQTFLANSPSYAENVADIQMQSASLGADQLELAKDQFRRDLSAYQQCLDSIVEGVKSLESRNAELLQRAKDNGRELNAQEQLEFDTNLLRINRMYALGGQEVNAVYSFIGAANRQKYYLESNSHYNRETGNFDGLMGSGLSDETIIYGNIAFDDIVKGVYTTHDLVKQYAGLAMEGVALGAQFFIGSRLGKSPIGKAGGVPRSPRMPASNLSPGKNDWQYNPSQFGL